MTKFKTLLSIAGLSTLVLSGAASTAEAHDAAAKPVAAAQGLRPGKGERHPEIRKAMNALTRAKSDLQNAKRDFGGHRAKAAALIDQALAECRAALTATRR